MMDRILIIDGHNAMWRSKIAFTPKKPKPNLDHDPPQFVGPEPIVEDFTMVYNFFRSLRATIEQFEPTRCFFVLEGAHNFRYKIYPDYKANRIVKTGNKQNIKEDYHRQKEIILSLISSLPIVTVKADRFECDDVIATLVEDLKEEDVTILSNDSDFIQLLQKEYTNLKIFNPFTKKNMEAPEYHYVAWKCLAGDTSDNIHGLVGKGKAVTLVKSPDALQEFLSSDENIANFNLNKELIELKIVPHDELEFTDYNVNYDLLKREFTRMQFKTMLTDKYWDNFIETFACLG